MTYNQELRRKAIHLGSSFFPLLYLFLDKQTMLLIVLPLAFGTLLIDFSRRRIPWLNRLFHKVLGEVLRSDEDTKLTGGSYVMLAMFITIALFPKSIAIASLLILSLGDSAAALIGRPFGHHKIHKDKSWEGSLSFWVVATIAGALVPGISLVAATIAAATGALVELYLNIIDDNIFIPIASGLVLTVLLAL